ncbi:MAG: Pirin-related protein [Rhodobacteraceae bacterium HLUCCA08]|nr:MAG: Pirin-related protein [Rhodobacteraceae bacterium HLUCCA08]
MSFAPTPDSDGPIAFKIIPRARDIGGFEVRRALPAPQAQLVGPFIFFDQVGPAEFITGQGIDVRPHPHIGLATITYLYEGAFQHRDSLGTTQMIHPGAVNWMIAGRGVTHSERTSAETRAGTHRLFGVQTWIALPETAETGDAGFEHHGAEALPVIEAEGATARLIAGRGWGQTAPTRVFTDMIHADVTLDPGAALPLPDDHEDRGIHVMQGTVEVAGDALEAGQMAVFRPGDALSLRAGPQGARLIVLGGETLSGPRYIWWNFVASSEAAIHEARQDWAAGAERFMLPPGDTEEFIPVPELDGRPRRIDTRR